MSSTVNSEATSSNSEVEADPQTPESVADLKQEEKPLLQTNPNIGQATNEQGDLSEPPPWLGLVPWKYKKLCLVSIIDVSITTTVCRDVFFGSCLTSVSPRLIIFLAIRLAFMAMTLYGAHTDNTRCTSGFLLLFLLQMLGMLVYIASIIFSKEWGSFDVILATMTSAILVSAELYLLTIFQVNFAKKKSKAEWRSEMKKRGKTSALERDLEREKESKEADYFKMMHRLFAYFRPRGRILSYCAIGITVTKVCSSLKPLVYASMMDALINKDWEQIKEKLIRYFAILIVENIFHYIQAYYQRLSRELVELDLRKVAYKKCLSMECGYFDPLSTGEILSTVYHDVGDVTCHLGWQLRCLLDFSIQTIMTIFIIFSLDHRLAICACIVAPVMAAGLQYFNQHCHRISQLNSDNWKSITKMATETIANIRTVKVFGSEKFEVNLLSELLDETYGSLMEEVWYCETRWTFCNFLPQLSKLMLLYYSISLVLADEITFGELTAFMVYQGHINWIFHSLAEQCNTLSRLMIKSHKVFKLIDRDCELTRTMPGVSPKGCQGTLELSNVTFAYPTKKDTNVLHDLSLKVNPGEVIALVGHSGCGKTTVVKLMAYLYGPQQGSVTLDGVPVGDYTTEAFSERVVCVPQEPVLFARSLHDNIAYGRHMTRDQVIHAAKMANAHEFIIKQPQGYDSVVGERGITLSGGQRQRVCIARALARGPTVLLLDEATASLDSKSEHLVHKAIDNIIMGDERQMSLVIVAHRLSTVKNADRIFVLKEGCVVEHGNHTTLMNADGPYASFVEQQMLGENEAKTEQKETEVILSDLLQTPSRSPQVSA